jgi:hypothetical protein
MEIKTVLFNLHLLDLLHDKFMPVILTITLSEYSTVWFILRAFSLHRFMFETYTQCGEKRTHVFQIIVTLFIFNIKKLCHHQNNL